MPTSSAICLWFLFFSASLASNIALFMIIFITTKWKMMSRRFLKNSQQRGKIAGRIQEIVEETYGRNYGSEAKFEREMNMAAGTYGHTKEGKFTIEFLIEFCEKHRISLDWLMRKVGNRDLPPSEAEKPTK